MNGLNVITRIRTRLQPNEQAMNARRAKRPLNFDLPDETRWNHSIHYHRVLLAATPAGASRALDIGCGEGLLTRQIRELATEVIGIDLDAVSIERARSQASGRTGLNYVIGDFRTHPLDAGTFDVVTAVNAVHQVDTCGALQRMATLVRPGGVVGIIGVARRRMIADSPYDGLMFFTHLFRIKTNKSWDHGAPMTMPTQTFADIKQMAFEMLPGSTYKRRMLGRYTIVWQRPIQ